MELGNAWPAVLSRGVESVAQAGLETRAQFARLEEKVREDWELDNRIAELLRPNRRWRRKFCIQYLAIEYVVVLLVMVVQRCGNDGISQVVVG